MTQHTHGHLLIRLDVLITLVADRRGLALDKHGRLVDADAQLVADALDLGDAARSPRGQAAVELLRSLAEAIGLLRDRGDRLEATTLRHPWAQLDPELRAGLVYAAWCHRTPWDSMLGDVPDLVVHALRDSRNRVLRLLLDLPTGVDVGLADLVGTLTDRLGLPGGQQLAQAVSAVFLDPLAALGYVQIDPPSTEDPRIVRLDPRAHTVIGAALIAAGEDVPPSTRPATP